jgi:hypothetical protein
LSGGAADPKRLPFILFAGRFLLKDISSPATSQHTITDATSFSACYALHSGECRTDSSAGDRYVSVPFAAGGNQCLTNQYEEVAPCFFNASALAGRVQQMDISGSLDVNGAHQRMLPAAFTGIGGQYQFSAPKMSPDGAWMFLPCWWLNGIRSEVCGVFLPPFPVADSVVRSTYIPHDVSISGSSGDRIRLCWGYAENGPVDGSPNSLYPTARQERGCSLGSVAAAAGNTATFVKSDSTTEGAWKPLYGSDGYNVVSDSAQYPAYANVNIAGASSNVWSVPTSDIRALQRVSTSGNIAASLFSATSFTVDLNLSDGVSHTVGFYFLDWDGLNRTQTVQVLNADSGAVLDTRSLSNFSNGIYLVWSLSGHVTVKLTNTGPNSAVLSGVFFGSGPFGTAAITEPFGWVSEPPKYADCGNGCRVRMNLIPDRVAYYIIERNRGGIVTTSPVMVAAPR